MLLERHGGFSDSPPEILSSSPFSSLIQTLYNSIKNEKLEWAM